MPGSKFRVRAVMDQCGHSKKLKPWVPDRTLVGIGRKVFIPGPAMALDMKRFGSGSASASASASASGAKVGGGLKLRTKRARKNRRKTLRKMRA
jgi:hypothetical protein